MTEKRRLLCFTSSLAGGGAEKHLLRVIKSLNRTSFEISLAVARKGGVFEHLVPSDVSLHTLSTGGHKSSTLRMARAIYPLRQIIRKVEPDILYSVMDYANIVALAAVKGLKTPPITVLSVQNTPSQAYLRPGNYWGRFFVRMMRSMYPQADSIVALSWGVANDLLNYAPKVAEHMCVIYNAGVDQELLTAIEESVEYELNQDAPLIVACGSLTEQKGFTYLLEAFSEVGQVLPARLWIIGEGPKRAELERKIKELDLSDSVRLLGFQTNPYKFMAASHVFVLSSLWEGFGNVVVEAMASGAAVVATDCPHGPAEIITHEQTGLLVPPADPSSLAQAILRLLHDAQLRERLSRNGQSRARDFDAQIIASQYENLFLELLSTKRI